MSAFTRSALLLHCKAADARALGSVTTLDLSKQNIAQLDIDFAELPLLRVLNLSGNQLSFLPASIKCLTKLTFLNLSQNKFRRLGVDLSGLTQLRSLLLNNNELAELPSLSSMNELCGLVLSHNSLTNCPDVSGCRFLNKLSLSHNQLRAIPETLSSNTLLTELRVNGNMLSALPECIGSLPKLKLFDLGNNEIRQFSALLTLQSAPALTNLNLKGNPICAPRTYQREALKLFPRLEQLDNAKVDAARLRSDLPQSLSHSSDRRENRAANVESEPANSKAKRPLVAASASISKTAAAASKLASRQTDDGDDADSDGDAGMGQFVRAPPPQLPRHSVRRSHAVVDNGDGDGDDDDDDSTGAAIDYFSNWGSAQARGSETHRAQSASSVVRISEDSSARGKHAASKLDKPASRVDVKLSKGAASTVPGASTRVTATIPAATRTSNGTLAGKSKSGGTALLKPAAAADPDAPTELRSNRLPASSSASALSFANNAAPLSSKELVQQRHEKLQQSLRDAAAAADKRRVVFADSDDDGDSQAAQSHSGRGNASASANMNGGGHDRGSTTGRAASAKPSKPGEFRASLAQPATATAPSSAPAASTSGGKRKARSAAEAEPVVAASSAAPSILSSSSASVDAQPREPKRAKVAATTTEATTSASASASSSTEPSAPARESKSSAAAAKPVKSSEKQNTGVVVVQNTSHAASRLVAAPTKLADAIAASFATADSAFGGGGGWD